MHHVLLVKDDAVSFFENILQLGQLEGAFRLAVFAVDEIVDHAALDGRGAVECVERGEVFDARWLIAAENVAHPVRFKLENGRGVAARKKLVRFLVFQ